MPIVTFLPDRQQVEVSAGARLLTAVQRARRPIGLSCRGRGICVACRLRVQGSMQPIAADEAVLLEKIDEPGAWRIACLARVADADVQVQADYW
jgi:ferredoxin